MENQTDKKMDNEMETRLPLEFIGDCHGRLTSSSMQGVFFINF